MPSGSDAVPKDEELKLLHEFSNTIDESSGRTTSSLPLPMFSKISSIVAATRTKSLKRQRNEADSPQVLSKRKKTVIVDSSDDDPDRDAWNLFD